jgi:hypothetical protein
MISVPPFPAGRIVLLGPQPTFSELAPALDAVEARGPVALITAGWQENEGEDGALSAALGRDTINLALHARSEDVYSSDEPFRAASAARQKHLQHLQDFYRVRLEAIDDADRAIAVRHVDAELLEDEREISVSQLRHLDADHLARCEQIRAEFEETWDTATRPVVARHRDDIARILSRCDAIVISGGHVMSLRNRIRLFDVFAAVTTQAIVAWSAGAMTLCDRLVLFHDSPPFGKNLAQVVDRGVGFCPGIVAMPAAAQRIHTDATRGIARYASRMAPACCLTLNEGENIVFQGGQLAAANTTLLSLSGEVVQGWRP